MEIYRWICLSSTLNAWSKMDVVSGVKEVLEEETMSGWVKSTRHHVCQVVIHKVYRSHLTYGICHDSGTCPFSVQHPKSDCSLKTGTNDRYSECSL